MAILDVFKKTYHPTTKAELKELVNNNKIKLSQIDVSKMTDFEEVFRNCKRTDFSGIEKWDVSNVTNFRNCFRDCKGFNADISGWNTSNAKTMSCMFAGCENFDCDISKWDVSKIQGRYKASYIGNMFKGCEKFANHVHDIYTQAEAKGVAKEEIFNLMPFPRPKDHKVVILPQYQNDFNEIAGRTEDLSTIDTSAVRNFNNFLRNSARKTFTGIEKMSMESARYCKNFLSGAKNFAQKFAITRKSKELRDAEKELKKVKKDFDKNTAKVFKLFKKYYKDLPEGKANKPTVRLYTSALMYFSNYEKTDEQIKKYKNILSGCPKDLLEVLKNQRKLYDQYYDLDKKCNDLIDRDQNAIAQGKVVTEEEAKGKDLPKETVVEKAELPKVTNIDSMCKGTQVNHAVPVAPSVKTARNAYAENDKFLADLSGLKDAPIKYCQGAFDKVDPAHLAKELKDFPVGAMKAEFCRKILEPNLIENEPRSNFSVCERNIRSNTLENKQSNLYDLKFVQEASKYKVIVFEDQEQMDLCTKKLNELGFFKEPTKDFTQFTYQGSEYNGCPTIVVPPEMYNVLKDVSIPSKHLSNYAEPTKEFSLEKATINTNVKDYFSSTADIYRGNELVELGNRNIYSIMNDYTYNTSGVELNTFKDLKSLSQEEFKQKQVDTLSNLSKMPDFKKKLEFIKKIDYVGNRSSALSQILRHEGAEFGSYGVCSQSCVARTFNTHNDKETKQVINDLLVLSKTIENYEFACQPDFNEKRNNFFKECSSLEPTNSFINLNHDIQRNYNEKFRASKNDRVLNAILNNNFQGIDQKQTQEKTQKQEPIKHEEKRVSKSSMRR